MRCSLGTGLCINTSQQAFPPRMESLAEQSSYEQNRPVASNNTKAGPLPLLNTTCYNGLYGVNSDGRFNVPFGKYDKMPRLFDATNLRGASKLLASATIEPSYYNVVLKQFHAGEGDFVYLDPPYAVESGNG